MARSAAAVVRPKSLIDLWLGAQLRQLRKRRGLSLAEVSAACDVSLGMLSQIERGLSAPSLRALQALSRLYGVSIDDLLRNAGQDGGDTDGHVLRAGLHRRIDSLDRGVSKEVYTPPRSSTLDLCRAVLAPGGASGDELFVTDTHQQVGLVVRGELDLWIGQRVVRLRSGDSFCYAGNEPRRWCNPGDTETEVIWAISHSASQASAGQPPPPGAGGSSISTDQQGE
ncbi:transcriptional regulator [Bordetella ansorpii]|uniref:Transcriptional regulator n=1 Tax=Bordetella ansorpii TaxID=288768 RepID=A0A157SP57_9BORD|nr:XRE family transcriptional regulator [Bordetella ansorpii]SAI72081.1 transcriptional regulator [Bordetella ansorpii]